MALASVLASPGLAASRSVLPDEISATGGDGAALGDSGSALVTDQSAIHINPAMLFLHKTYDVGGTYVWPREGRPFYRAAAIDGATSKWTTAFEYTGFSDSLEPRDKRDKIDSPVRRRGSLAFAIPTSMASIGLAGNYVEAEDPTSAEVKTVKGFTLGAGIVAQLSGSLRFGASAENLNNDKLKDVSPRTYRAGLAYEIPNFALYTDYRSRARSAYLEGQPLTEEGTIALQALATPTPVNQPEEKMMIVGGQAQALDIVRFFAAAGKNVGGDKHDVAAGGIGLYQKNFSLAYALSRNYPDSKDLQSSVHLSVTMKL